MPKTEVFVMGSKRNISVLRINTFQESFARITQIQVLFKSKSNLEQILLLLFLVIRMGKAWKAGPSSCWVPPGSAKPLVVKNTEAHADLYFFFIAKQLLCLDDTAESYCEYLFTSLWDRFWEVAKALDTRREISFFPLDHPPETPACSHISGDWLVSNFCSISD